MTATVPGLGPCLFRALRLGSRRAHRRRPVVMFALLVASAGLVVSHASGGAEAAARPPQSVADTLWPRPAAAALGPGAPDRTGERRRPPEWRVPPEELCDSRDLPIGTELTPAAVDSIGKAYSRHNTRVMHRADSLLQAGVFGDPAAPEAQRDAAIFLELRSRNAMDFIVDLALQPDIAWFDSRHDLHPLLDRHANLAMYPLNHTDTGRVGAGSFCLRYHIPRDYDETFHFGSAAIRVRTDQARLRDGSKVDVLNREWLSGDGSKLELLYEATFSGRVSREIIEDRGDKLELLTFDEIHGLHVRRYGTHQMTTMVVWRNVIEGDGVPAHPRVGGVAYFPQIHLRLPVFLPDIGLDDLRDLAFPPPLMESRLFQEPRDSFPSWVRTTSAAQFLDWYTLGELPEIVRERYPDQ